MRSDALDIIIEGRGDATWLILSGPFNKEQIPNIRGKFTALIEDGNRHFVVDMDGLVTIDSSVPQMFLAVLSDVRGRGGDIKFVFKNQTVSNAFALYTRLLSIFPSAEALASRSNGLIGRLFRRGSVLSKKTGVRISRQVAIFLLIVLCGWFLSLLFIIHLQNRRITEQEKELSELSQWKQRSILEISRLKDRIRPLEQLGVLRDTVKE